MSKVVPEVVLTSCLQHFPAVAFDFETGVAVAANDHSVVLVKGPLLRV